MIATPWTEHFDQFEADEFRPPFDPVDPIEHYTLVRDALALGSVHFEPCLRSSLGRKFPPTVVLRALTKKESVPLILEWPDGIFPSIALQCQLALLLALANEKEAAEKLAEKLAPLVLGGFWTLWTLEKEYREDETRLSCALFLQAIGRFEEADRLYSPTLPNSPFFKYLYHAKIQIQISPLVQPTEAIAWTLNGSKAGLGAIKIGPLEVTAFGPHGYPLSNPNLFGICEAGSQWFCSNAQKEVWFQIERQQSKANEARFSLHSLGISFEKPMAFVFYIKAGECRIGEKVFKPKSLHRFLGEVSSLQFEGVNFEIDRPLKIELIPLAGGLSFWGADFLLAFWLSPISNKVFFQLHTARN